MEHVETKTLRDFEAEVGHWYKLISNSVGWDESAPYASMFDEDKPIVCIKILPLGTLFSNTWYDYVDEVIPENADFISSTAKLVEVPEPKSSN